MLQLPPIQKLGFQNPWKNQLIWNRQFRYNAEAMAEEGMDEDEQQKLRTAYDQNDAQGNKTFKLADHAFDKESQEEKQFLTRALQRFQAATGIDESKYIQRIEEAKSMGKVRELEKEFKRAGVTFYKQKMDKSGLFIPMDVRETAHVDDEKKMYFNWIEKQPLDTDDTDEGSIVEALSHLDEHLEERREGRERLNKQSAYVKNEYFRQIGSMAADGSKEKLLDKILKSVGNLEKEPSSIQAEFKKMTKGLDGRKDTEAVLKELKAQYEKLSKEYEGILESNKAYFGGKETNTPKGKMRGAHWEFVKWFSERKSFSQMASDTDALKNNVLPERIKVYGERDKMVAALPEAKRAAILQKTDEMRLHTLKSYLKDTKSSALRESVVALEYLATLETAEHDSYPLFNSEEKMDLKRVIQSSSPELQEAELKVLVGRMIPERAAQAKEYDGLPQHLRSDHRFFTANTYDKGKMLHEAKRKQDHELKNPFDIESLQSLSAEDKMSTLMTKLDSASGKMAVRNARRELSQEGKTQALDTQMKVVKVMSGEWKQIKQSGNTQVENYMDSIYEGAKVNNKKVWKGAWQTGVAKDEHQQYMADTAKTDLGAYLALRGRTWGGKSVEIGKVTQEEFKRGDKSMLNKLGKALYPENMLFLNSRNEDELKPGEEAAEMLGDSSRAEMIQLAKKLGFNFEEMPVGFREAVAQIAIVQENAGIFSRMDAFGGEDIIEEAVN